MFRNTPLKTNPETVQTIVIGGPVFNYKPLETGSENFQFGQDIFYLTDANPVIESDWVYVSIPQAMVHVEAAGRAYNNSGAARTLGYRLTVLDNGASVRKDFSLNETVGISGAPNHFHYIGNIPLTTTSGTSFIHKVQRTNAVTDSGAAVSQSLITATTVTTNMTVSSGYKKIGFCVYPAGGFIGLNTSFYYKLDYIKIQLTTTNTYVS